MKTNFTEKFLKAAKPPEGVAQVDHYDAHSPGLILRVTKEKKTWGFMFTDPVGGKRARLTLGTFPATDLVTARQRATEARGLVEQGKDPRAVAAAPTTHLTVSQLVDDRIRLEVRADAESYLRSCMEIERMYDKDVIPVVGNVLVKDFRISHLNRVIDPVVARGAPTQANRVFEVVRALLDFGVRRGEIDFNPLTKAKAPSEEKTKDRWLVLDEVRHLWVGCSGAMAKSVHMPDIVRLILALGQRPGEVAGIERSEIDLHKRLWIMPAAKVKNGHEHWVPLNDLAVAILSRRLRETNGDFLFPNEAGDGSIANYIVSQTVARACEPEEGLPLGRMGVAKFTPHDLRRTVATQMSLEENRLGIPELYISHVLNHRTETKRSITSRVYNKNQYLNEKREALDKWGRFLAKLVGEQIEEREAA